jgi:hypothetical protein
MVHLEENSPCSQSPGPGVARPRNIHDGVVEAAPVKKMVISCDFNRDIKPMLWEFR